MKRNPVQRRKRNEEGIEPGRKPWQFKVHQVIFEHDTPAGKSFDVILLWVILFSIAAVMLESVRDIRLEYGSFLKVTEWFFTILFSIEFIARIISVRQPRKYLFSFFGIIDFLAIIPTYLSVIVVGSHYLIVIRALRLLRVFRIFKLGRYVGEGQVLKRALKASRHKITVFMGVVISIVIIIGTIMYLVEGPETGFSSIPRSIYWAIVTVTTVGYGDIAPQSFLGQVFASVLMITGYAFIAVPTGIVTVELSNVEQNRYSFLKCPQCSFKAHDIDARFCKMCGTLLKEPEIEEEKEA